MTDLPVLTDTALDRLMREQSAWLTSYIRALRDHADNVLGVQLLELDGATAWNCRALPDWSLFNGMLDIHRTDPARLPEALAFADAPGVRAWVTTDPAHTPREWLLALHAAGLQHLDWDQLTWCRTDEPRPDPPAGVLVRKATADDRDAFIGVYLAAEPSILNRRADVGHHLARAEWGMYETAPAWMLFAACLADEPDRPVAFAALHVDGDAGSPNGAWTHPAARGRGCQLALLLHRIGHARDVGCDLLVSMAEVGSVSLRNQQRAGLRPMLTQSLWGRPAR